MSTEARLTDLENELKALKQTTPVSLGALRFPASVPTADYIGSIDTSSQDYIVARLAATFTRSDGVQITPMVDFAYTVSISPTYQEYMATQGVTITGNDPNVNTEAYMNGFEASTTADSVTFNIDVLNAIAPYAGSTANIIVHVEAISPLEGTLTITRVK